MSAKKRPKNMSSNYIITMNFDNFDKDTNCIGKLRSNFLGTEFNLYDSGKNPKDCDNSDEWRSHFATIVYETNLFGLKGPRNFKVHLVGLTETETMIELKPSKKEDGILELAKKKDKRIITFVNKQPKWSEGKFKYFDIYAYLF